jgi:hypothetical protein
VAAAVLRLLVALKVKAGQVAAAKQTAERQVTQVQSILAAAAAAVANKAVMLAVQAVKA